MIIPNIRENKIHVPVTTNHSKGLLWASFRKKTSPGRWYPVSTIYKVGPQTVSLTGEHVTNVFLLDFFGVVTIPKKTPQVFAFLDDFLFNIKHGNGNPLSMEVLIGKSLINDQSSIVIQWKHKVWICPGFSIAFCPLRS